MKIFERVSSFALTAVNIVLCYNYYDTISEHSLLKVCLYASIALGIFIIIIDIFNAFLKSLKVEHFLSGMRAIFVLAFLGCFFAGVYYRINDNQVIITGDVYSVVEPIDNSVTEQFGDNDIDIEEIRGGSDGFVRTTQGVSYERIMRYHGFATTISNYSQKSIQIKVKDAVSLELIEFIPYDQLDISQVLDEGGDVPYYPIVFTFDVNTTPGMQEIETVSENQKVISDSGVYYTIEPNEIRELCMLTTFQEEGYYRFRYSINYYKAGKKYTFPFQECECIVKREKRF